MGETLYNHVANVDIAKCVQQRALLNSQTLSVWNAAYCKQLIRAVWTKRKQDSKLKNKNYVDKLKTINHNMFRVCEIKKIGRYIEISDF